MRVFIVHGLNLGKKPYMINIDRTFNKKIADSFVKECERAYYINGAIFYKAGDTIYQLRITHITGNNKDTYILAEVDRRKEASWI